MRFISVFQKSMREQLRSYWMLILTLSIAPVFVILYWFITGGGSTSYKLLIINHDVSTEPSASEQVIHSIQDLTYANGQPIIKIKRVADQNAAETSLKNREAAALIIFPQDFTSKIEQAKTGASPAEASLTIIGDFTNVYYPIVSIMAFSAVDQYLKNEFGQTSPVIFNEIPLGAYDARTEFESYVPALLILSIVMMIFQVSMTIVREVEGGTLRRLKMTRMTSFDLLGGISLTQVLIGIACAMLTFITAKLLGFRSQGSLWLAVLVGALTSFSIIGIGLVMACFAKTTGEAFIFSNFPLIFLMFFTGAAFPIQSIPIFNLAGHNIGLFDILPPTHAVVALNKVFTFGAGIKDIAYELGALIVLSILYFAIGIWLFKRTRLKPD